MKSNYKPIGKYIQRVEHRNRDLKVTRLLGLSMTKEFRETTSNIVGTDMSVYRVMSKYQFACDFMSPIRVNKLPVVLKLDDEPNLVSPAYPVFEIKDRNELDPEYLMMWFRRTEFDRYATFKCDAAIRGGYEWTELCETLIPVPSITKQRGIVKEYNVIQNRIALNQQLIQKLEETAQAIYKQWFVEFEFPDENGKPYKSNGGKIVWNEELEKEIPLGWEVGELSKIATIIMGQSPEGETYNKDGNGMIFYQGRTDFGYRFPDITTFTTHPKKKALKNDILISVRAPVGDLNIAIEDCAIGRGVGALRSKLKCNSHLFYTLQNLKSHFDISDGEGTIFGSINKDDLHNVEVVYSENEIKKFDKVTRPIDDSIKNYSIQNQKLTELKDLLLSKLATIEN
jgi:type I restriction enzyme, S subunit